MRASQHVIRRPAAPDEAVPEAVVETKASVTTRIDMTQLNRAVADCVESVDDDDDVEIQLEAAEVRAAGSQRLAKVGRSGLAHTTRRAGTENPAAVKPMPAATATVTKPMPAAVPIAAPVTHTSKTTPVARIEDEPKYGSAAAVAKTSEARPLAAPMDTARPIDEIAEARAVEVLMGEMRSHPRVKLGYVVAALAVVGGAVALIACM